MSNLKAVGRSVKELKGEACRVARRYKGKSAVLLMVSFHKSKCGECEKNVVDPDQEQGTGTYYVVSGVCLP